MFERILLNGGAAGGGWILDFPGNNTYVAASTVDASGNVYCAGSTGGNLLVFKVNAQGVLQWQRALDTASTSERYKAISLDSSNNVYAFCYQSKNSAGSWDGTIVKYDTNGTLQWQRRLGGTAYDAFNNGVSNSAGTTYAVGQSQSQTAGGTDVLVASYNSSGTIQWQRRLGGTGSEVGFAIGVDSSNNVFIGGITSTTSAGGNDALLVKYNSTGTVQWQRRLGTANGDGWYGKIGFDGSGNIYVAGSYNNMAGYLIAKYDSTGAVVWQRQIATGMEGLSSAVDSSGNLYVSGGSPSYGYGNGSIIKYDASGNVVWQRQLSNLQPIINDIALDNSGFMYLSGNYSGSLPPVGSFVAKLPVDGSGTGTYGSWTYASASFTASTPAYTAANTTLTAATTTLTAATSTLVATTPSISFTVQNL